MIRNRLACSFCRKPDTEVAKLVAGPRVLLFGPRVHICDACVAVSARLMEQAVDPATREMKSRGFWARLLGRHPFQRQAVDA